MVAAVVWLAGSLTATYALQAPTQDVKTFEGKLAAVDLQKKTVDVEGKDGKAMKFMYTEQTEITGSNANIQGLANTPGTNLRIHYRQQQESNIAVKLEVLPAGDLQ
jgi:hypothetical protein